MTRFKGILLLIGRVLVSGFILWIVVYNLFHMGEAVDYAVIKGLPLAFIFVPAAQLLLGICGILILTGIRPLFAYVGLAVFLIPVTWVMHPFWMETAPDPMTMLLWQVDFHSFQANGLLLGMVTMMAALTNAPWPYSLDNWFSGVLARFFGRRAALNVT